VNLPELSDFERELLELLELGGSWFGVATASLDEELLAISPGAAAIEAVMGELCDRGLVRSELSAGSLSLRPRSGVDSEHDERAVVHREFEARWWILTDEGRAAIGLPAAAPHSFWMNPSSGPFRVSPLLAPWFAFRARRGKAPWPRWYARLRRIGSPNGRET
jgi:hypothetical protein